MTSSSPSSSQSTYRAIFDAGDESAASGTRRDDVPLVPLSRSKPTRGHGKQSSEDHDATESDDDDAEVLGLMDLHRRRRTSEDGDEEAGTAAKEHATPEQPLFYDEDLDVDSAAAMVRRVSRVERASAIPSTEVPCR